MTENVEWSLHLEPHDVALLVGMGPNARHVPAAQIAGAREDLASVDILYFRRLDTPAPNPSE
jgi:hypothetical protein